MATYAGLLSDLNQVLERVILMFFKGLEQHIQDFIFIQSCFFTFGRLRFDNDLLQCNKDFKKYTKQKINSKSLSKIRDTYI